MIEKKNFIVLKDSIINVGKCLYIEKDVDDCFLEITFSNDEWLDIYCESLEDLEFNWNLLLTELGSR